MRKLLLFCALSVVSLLARAEERPQAHFGKFGIERSSLVEQYQRYAGQTVIYVPQPTPSYYDTKKFEGEFNTPYIITKVTRHYNSIIFTLIEKNTRAKVKFAFSNDEKDSESGHFTIYHITDEYTAPLLFVEKLEEEKNRLKGTTYPQRAGSNIKLELTDVILVYRYKNAYPRICYELTDASSGRKFTVEACVEGGLAAIGKVYTNPKVKASYVVVGAKIGSYYDKSPMYTVMNSITGETKEVWAKSAQTECFAEDLLGTYNVTLSKVERTGKSAPSPGKISAVKDEGITKHAYIDDCIDIRIYTTWAQFCFMLKNVSENTIKVIWNEAAFVDSDGSSSKIVHFGIDLAQREGDQPATTIIKGAYIDDSVYPTKNVRYSETLENWTANYLLPREAAMTVKPMKLMLPIQTQDGIYEYIFEFSVEYIYYYPDRINL